MGWTITDERGRRVHKQGRMWFSGGRYRFYEHAEKEAAAARARGLQAKIKRMSDGQFLVKTRDEIPF